MTVYRCNVCKVAWEDGQPAKHLMTCAIHDFVREVHHRKPTEMESLVMTAMAGWNIGEDRFEVARAVIRAMREPTAEMLREAGMVVAGNTEAHAAVWETMIDAASPQEE
jgi:hypothetical protein